VIDSYVLRNMSGNTLDWTVYKQSHPKLFLPYGICIGKYLDQNYM